MLFWHRSLQVNVVVCVKLYNQGSCCVSSQPGDWCKSSGSPEKQVSQLFISCQVLGCKSGMLSACKGCWGRCWMVTCFSNLVGRLEGKGGWEDSLLATLTNSPNESNNTFSVMFWMNTRPEPEANTSTCCPIAAFCRSSVIRKCKAQILYSVTQPRRLFPKSARGIMVMSEWLFLLFITDKWDVDRIEERESEREKARERE